MSKKKEKRPHFWPILALLRLNIGELLTKRSDSVSCSIIYLTQAFLVSTKNEHGLKLAFFTKMAQNGEKIMVINGIENRIEYKINIKNKLRYTSSVKK